MDWRWREGSWSAALLITLCALPAVRDDAVRLRLEPGGAIEVSGVRPDTAVDAILVQSSGPPEAPYRGADFASYLRAGRTLLREGRFDWAYARLWTPGQPIVIAGALAALGSGAYLRHMQWISVLAWASVLWLVCLPFRGHRRLAACLYAGGAWLMLPELATFNFGLGAMMSESLSTAFFVLGAALMVRASRASSFLWPAGGAGVAFGVAALFRPYFEFVLLHPMITLGALGFAWGFARSRFRRDARSARWAAVLLVAALSAQATTIPWRIHRQAQFGSASLTNFDQLANWAFARDDELPAFHHGGNVACHADPDLCELVRANRERLRPSLVRKFVLMTLVTRPRAWLGEKLRHFDWFWWGAPAEVLFGRPILLMEGLASIVLGLLGLVLLSRAAQRRTHGADVLLVLIGGFLSANALGFSLFQFEWRYSHSIRLGAYLLPLLIAPLAARLDPNAGRESPSPTNSSATAGREAHFKASGRR